MPPVQTGEPGRNKENRDGEQLKSVIRNRVLRSLGEPGGLGRVQVRALWDNYYRVNIFIEENPGCIRIAGSYFVEADDAGNIVASTPELTMRD